MVAWPCICRMIMAMAEVIPKYDDDVVATNKNYGKLAGAPSSLCRLENDLYKSSAFQIWQIPIEFQLSFINK